MRARKEVEEKEERHFCCVHVYFPIEPEPNSQKIHNIFKVCVCVDIRQSLRNDLSRLYCRISRFVMGESKSNVIISQWPVVWWNDTLVHIYILVQSCKVKQYVVSGINLSAFSAKQIL